MLVGRDRERSRLAALVDAAKLGSGGVLAVVGEAGIGKTALLEDVFGRAEDLRRLRARGVHSEAQIPFAGLFELVRPALGSLERIPTTQAAALEGALALRPSRGEDRLAIGAATLSLLAAYAEEQPLLVLVDDVHWLDASSASALLFAARRLGADPVAILLGARDGEPSLLDGSDIPQLRLGGLDLTASRALLSRRDDADEDDKGSAPYATAAPLTESAVTRLFRETGGNPLALIELGGRSVSTWADATPLEEPITAVSGVARAFVSRFESLPPASRRFLLLAAASDSPDLELLSRAGRQLDTSSAELEPAISAGLVSLSGDTVEWRHPLARSAVYASVHPEERRAAHRSLADTLPDRESDRRAWHLALSADGYDDAAASALTQAAGRARDRSAYDESSQGFSRAASLTADGERRARLLYMAADVASLGALSVRAEEFLSLAEKTSSDRVLWVQIQHLRGQLASRRGDVLVALDTFLAGAEVAAEVEPARAVVMLAEAVNLSFLAGRLDAMLAASARIGEIAQSLDDSRSHFFATMSEGMALVFSGEATTGRELIRRAVRLLEETDELRDDLRLLDWAIFGPLWLRETAGPLVERALSAARERAAAGVLPFVLWPIALDRAASDRWDEAEAFFHEAINGARENGQRKELAAALARLAGLEARTGQAHECRAHAREALDLSVELGLMFSEIWALGAFGDLELSQGRPEDALTWYRRQVAVLEKRHISDADMSPVPEMVEALLRLGEDREAAALAEQYVRDATAKGFPWAMARAARARGLVAGRDEYEAIFLAALELHDETPDLFEKARTRLAFATRLRRFRSRVRAREELRNAIDEFDRLGAEPWADAARNELAATGEHIGPRSSRRRWELTPQEMQIALLLAERRTTREAAAALFLSPKTIEYHLRSVYRKLGINSRDELVDVILSRPSESLVPDERHPRQDSNLRKTD